VQLLCISFLVERVHDKQTGTDAKLVEVAGVAGGIGLYFASGILEGYYGLIDCSVMQRLGTSWNKPASCKLAGAGATQVVQDYVGRSNLLRFGKWYLRLLLRFNRWR